MTEKQLLDALFVLFPSLLFVCFVISLTGYCIYRFLIRDNWDYYKARKKSSSDEGDSE